jgi:hypothetical protein
MWGLLRLHLKIDGINIVQMHLRGIKSLNYIPQ